MVCEVVANNDVSHREEECYIGSDTDGKVEVSEFCEAGFTRVGDDEFSSFGECFF
jgi:hypothetical protein